MFTSLVQASLLVSAAYAAAITPVADRSRDEIDNICIETALDVQDGAGLLASNTAKNIVKNILMDEVDDQVIEGPLAISEGRYLRVQFGYKGEGTKDKISIDFAGNYQINKSEKSNETSAETSVVTSNEDANEVRVEKPIRKCLQDLILSNRSALDITMFPYSSIGQTRISTPEKPFRSVISNGTMVIALHSNSKTKQKLSIAPAKEFVNNGVLFLNDQGQIERNAWVPINLENELGSIETRSDAIVNNGQMIVRDTSLTIRSNFRKSQSGRILLKSYGQLIFALDRYDGSNTRLLEGQRIMFVDENASIFFERQAYDSSSTVFAAKLHLFRLGNAMIFEDKVENVKYNKTTGIATISIRIAENNLREMELDLGTNYDPNEFTVVRVPYLNRQFSNGSILIYEGEEYNNVEKSFLEK